MVEPLTTIPLEPLKTIVSALSITAEAAAAASVVSRLAPSVRLASNSRRPME